MRNSPLKAFANSQGLKPKALNDKRARDNAAAMTDKRKRKKAENKRIGQSTRDEIHHKPGRGEITQKTKDKRNMNKKRKRT